MMNKDVKIIMENIIMISSWCFNKRKRSSHDVMTIFPCARTRENQKNMSVVFFPISSLWENHNIIIIHKKERNFKKMQSMTIYDVMMIAFLHGWFLLQWVWGCFTRNLAGGGL